MIDDLAFMRAICADVDDDAPRLLYADFLDEKGDPASAARAEFIRVQCALAAAAPDDWNIGYLKRRERELLTTHSNSWLRPSCLALGEPNPNELRCGWNIDWLLNGQIHDHAISPARQGGHKFCYFFATQFRRGFPTHVALCHSESRGERHVARVWDKSPLDGMTLVSFSAEGVEKTLAAIDIRRLRSLELIDSEDGSISLINEMRELRNLRELFLLGSNESRDVGEVLCASDVFEGLQVLILANCAIDDVGVARICGSQFAGSLRRLELIGCNITNRAAQHIANYWPRASPLAYLDLGGNPISGVARQHLQERFGNALRFFSGHRSWPTRFYL